MRIDPIHTLCLVLGLDSSAEFERARIHPWLVATVEEAAELCRNAGGELVSRQVIASIVVAWRRVNPEEKAVRPE